jgi:PTS system glucitol/sorbitol-specific IIA component
MATAETRYAATVTAVGEQVPEFIGQGLLIWFAEGAPEELHFFTVLHRPTVTTGGVRPGDLVRIDDKAFRVTAVGEVATATRLTLGHIDMKANGASEAPLPGDLCLEELPLPEPRPGTELVIEGDAAAADPHR